MSDITIKRGDTYNYNINIKDSAGVAIDTTNWDIWFTVRKYLVSNTVISDTDALISKKYEGNSSGIIPIILSSTDTDIPVGNHYYDIQVKNITGIHSSSTGRFIVEADVTRDR
jgi:hypothetical protein